MTAGEYKDIFEFAYDMRLIWRNCCTYNQEGAEIYAVGKKLSDVFEEKFSSVQSLSLVLFIS
jgi:singapore isolate B (sub-type 7) whole genome shotgun sequence assembly, scaffold_3